ncbi:hypothetical protein U9M48_007731 [Paspalum notatum var. saurae]|uniref:Uncharacterized protein n=1 Tax=Paspalum notatum var. saurae TaxID=547442 RepID=A0AAQ3WC67_PASNO
MWKRRLGLRTLKEVRATRLPIRFESRNQGKGKGKFKPNKTTNFKKKKNKAELPRFTCGFVQSVRTVEGKEVVMDNRPRPVNTVIASKTRDTGSQEIAPS